MTHSAHLDGSGGADGTLQESLGCGGRVEWSAGGLSQGEEERDVLQWVSSLQPVLVLKAVQEAQQDSPIQLLRSGKTSSKSQVTC